MPHYMMDCFYRDAEGRLEPIRRDRRRLVAYNDHEAIKEAEGVAIWAKPACFEIYTATKKPRLVYKSPMSDTDA